jgi:peptidyl-prolyl cis-trans isomerase B (cyclophilin B)
MEEVDRIVGADTDYSDKPYEDQKMKKVTVDTLGVEYPQVEKM